MAGRKFISWQAEDGETTELSGYRITPRSQALTVHLPFGGFVWNRPVAVKVEVDGVEQEIPIVDATRVTQISIYIMAGFLSLLLGRVASRTLN